ncbi:integrase domain-containing protein [Entomomonas asaccharolytica]|uniref:Integrase domain-containing protein n=1 Tax=Entomomonas asaccharolytica TaxID=2785331 RepID=A0A974RXA2_9GAMM|nr:integrase domain-containing protein [Entomomonas asaccharolytica]QQP86061.1 integrase domain-containing protein [Entomomonas asaccharolytica]
MKIKRTLQQLARQAKGSFKTVHDREVIVKRLADYLQANNIQIKHIDHIKTKHIEGYIQSRQEQAISKRTLQNEMSAIRKTLTQAGREKLANSERLSNQSLNIHNTSRQGTKTAITDEQFYEIVKTSIEKDQLGIAACLQLSRYLGLRGEEAVQSIQSLKTWQKAISQGKDTVTVVYGTKGGRPRQTRIINQDKVKQAVDYAINIANQQNGKLIDKPSLKQAMTYWRNHTAALGLRGTISPHSLRYAYAHDGMQHYQEQGYSEKEALAMVSMDLGHGDGRGRYVKRVYAL